MNGLILSGGKSSRFGSDKGLVDYHGLPQRQYLFQLLSGYCARVYTSCKAEQVIPPELNPLPDKLHFDTPLNGLLTAIDIDPATPWLTVPVDMPMINENIIQFLMDHRNATKYATCFVDSDGQQPEPLLAVWEPRGFDALHTFYRKGGMSPKKFLIEYSCELLQPPDKSLYFNINTLEDLQRFRNRRS